MPCDAEFSLLIKWREAITQANTMFILFMFIHDAGLYCCKQQDILRTKNSLVYNRLQGWHNTVTDISKTANISSYFNSGPP